MIAPQAGFLPPIHQQNSRAAPQGQSRAGIFQQNLPQIQKYNQSQIHGSSVDQTISSYRNNGFGYRPDSQSQRVNRNQVSPQTFNQNNYSPNRNNPQNAYNQYGQNYNNYQNNPNIYEQNMNTSYAVPQGSQGSIEPNYGYNATSPYIQNDNFGQQPQGIDPAQNFMQYQQYQQYPQSQQQNLHNRNYQQPNQANNQSQQQMQYFYGQQQAHPQQQLQQSSQQNIMNSPTRRNYNQENQEHQNTSFQVGNYYGLQSRDRKAQSDNSRNSQQLQSMRVNNTFSDSKKINYQQQDNKQDLALALKIQMDEKKRKQMEEKEKNRLHELSLLNYNLQNNPFSKNQVNRQEQQIQKIKETSPNNTSNQNTIQQRQITSQHQYNYNYNQPSQNMDIQNAFVPRESIVELDQQNHMNNHVIQQNPQNNQLSQLNHFTQTNQLTQIPQVLMASQVENNINQNNQIYQTNTHVNSQQLSQQQTSNKTYQIQTQQQKKSFILANHQIIGQQEQKEKDVKSQKLNEYQTFLQQQIEEVKNKKKLEKQKKIEEDLFYEQQFQKQLQEEQKRDELDQQKKNQHRNKQDRQGNHQNDGIRNQTPITQAALAIEIAKQSIETAQNLKRQSSAQSTITQYEESKTLKRSNHQSRSQRSYTTNDEQIRVQNELERSSKVAIALQNPNPYEMAVQQQLADQQLMQKQYQQYWMMGQDQNQNSNAMEFQKMMGTMMNQLSENQQHIQSVLSSLKHQSDENTKKAQTQFKEIQKLIIEQQQSQKSVSQEMLGFGTQTSFRHDRLTSREPRSDKKQRDSIQKLLQQSPNQVSQYVGFNELQEQQKQNQTHHKTRSSQSVDRDSISSRQLLNSPQLQSKLKNTEPLAPYKSHHKEINDFINVDKLSKHNKRKVVDKLNELSNESVFLNSGPNDSSRVLDRISQNSDREGVRLNENGKESFNIDSLEHHGNHQKQQKYEMHPVQEDGQSNFESLRTSSYVKNASGSGEKNALKKSIKILNKLDVENILEKNQSRLDNLNELENKSQFIQHINLQNI